ncbi:hypothetical protein FACS1894172_18270 [Spirochaetia bacterium]|nr:hypothetical protein FACS1894164_17010 [Spirochaetia bacterium]GHU35908.1 hypothetical protein FACS1894172_18270 [Spirochaetia bacterium]
MAGTLQEGIRLFHLKRFEMAVEELLRVNIGTLDKEAASELNYYLGLVFTKVGRLEDALLYLEQVVTANVQPLKVRQCRMTLAYIYAVTKRPEMAEFELQKVVEGGYESALLYSTLAYAAWQQKQGQKAADLYQKALNLDDKNTTALNGLGFVLVDSGIDPARGLQLCQQAVDKNPQNPAYLDSLGWAFFKNGNKQEATNYLQKAGSLAPQEREIRRHIRLLSGASES